MTTVEYPCPICGQGMYHYLNKDTANLTLFEVYTCTRNHYDYRFQNGLTQVNVGSQHWEWFFSDPFSQIRTKMKEVTAAQNQLKETYDKT